jgi:EAL domain-containing protein (putative c-di-GMP-specific phosphodiesterase class I)
MVGPQEIAQLVTQGDLHVEFDSWVIRTAAAQAAQWIAAGVPLPLIAVNVWDKTLGSDELMRVVEGTRDLELEMPRGSAQEPANASTLRALRERGVRIASDSLAIEIDTVKLRPPLDPAIVGLAKTRGLRVVAEGVESADQQAQALSAGCEIVQGYVFGPEVSASEVSALARPQA